MIQVIEQLPLSSLSLKEGDVPLDDLRVIAEAAGRDPDVRATLMRRVDELLDRREAGDQDSYNDLTDLAVMGVFALAADRFDRAGRRDVAEYLIQVLYRAGELDDDWLLEAGEKTAGRFGPDIIDPAMRLLQEKGIRAECGTYVCSLLQVAADADEAVKQRVAKYCRGVVRDAPDRFERFSSIDPALWVLASLHDVKSLPMLRDIQQTAGCGELAWAIDRLEGKPTEGEDDRLYPWKQPVEKWLPRTVEQLRKRLEKDDPPDHEGEEEVERRRSAQQRKRHVEAFVSSAQCAALPKTVRESAADIAEEFLLYAYDYADAAPSDLDEDTVEEVLLDHFPRKAVGDKEYFEAVPDALAALFEFLEDTTVIPEGDPLIESARACREELVARAMDPRHWGPAKGLIMAAKADGVDVTSVAALQAYIPTYNVKLAGEHKADRRDTEAPTFVSRPIERGSRKVGRNEPCPCGSGRKYKKCCGP